MYRCESWIIKKAECQRIDAFKLWCWRRLLRVPWTARRSNQSIPKEISPEYSLEGLMLKVKLQYFGHPMWRTDSLEKTLMMGKIEGRRRRDNRRWDGWMASPTRWTWVWASSGSWWWTGKPGVLQSTGSQRVRHDWATGLNLKWIVGFPSWLSGKESTRQWRTLGFHPWLESPGEENGNPFQYSLPGESYGQRNLAGNSPWGLQRVWCNLATKQQQSAF